MALPSSHLTITNNISYQINYSYTGLNVSGLGSASLLPNATASTFEYGQFNFAPVIITIILATSNPIYTIPIDKTGTYNLAVNTSLAAYAHVVVNENDVSIVLSYSS